MKFKQKVLDFIWALLYIPLGLPLSLLLPWGRKRAKFERLNISDPKSRPFEGELAFEVSSEGELEQVYPLLKYLLNKGTRVELIYSSQSVKEKCHKLGTEYPLHLRLFRLPLLTHFFGNIFGGQSLRSWMSSSTLILCRYDFFPQLLSLDVKLGLVSASLKGKKNVSPALYNLFEFIVATSKEEEDKFKKFYKKDLMALDFRVERIGERIEKAPEKLGQFPYKEILNDFPKSNRLILGSCWPVEMEIFKNLKFQKDILDKKIHVCLAPHNLNEMEDLIQAFRKSTEGKIPIYEDVDAPTIKSAPGVVLITQKGILCELYSLFGQSFVGGGHGRSIHSVLEPYLAGNLIYCGPKTFRSTEYDFIMAHSPKDIHIVRKLSEFYDRFKIESISALEMEKRDRILAASKNEFGKIISLLNGPNNE